MQQFRCTSSVSLPQQINGTNVQGGCAFGISSEPPTRMLVDGCRCQRSRRSVTIVNLQGAIPGNHLLRELLDQLIEPHSLILWQGCCKPTTTITPSRRSHIRSIHHVHMADLQLDE
ncbi:hypothetical protein [Crateriforma conspicua]|uniref:hypothetical protein n=1 Tax=Crateriforma conspicua TaxID=2527996 RepID=UPI0013FCF71F|nr:hypothetical protein [Crateriforma conspicua]